MVCAAVITVIDLVNEVGVLETSRFTSSSSSLCVCVLQPEVDFFGRAVAPKPQRLQPSSDTGTVETLFLVTFTWLQLSKPFGSTCCLGRMPQATSDLQSASLYITSFIIYLYK